MKKRTLSLLVTAGLAALLLTGCAEAAEFTGIRQRSAGTPQTGEMIPEDAVDVTPQSEAASVSAASSQASVTSETPAATAAPESTAAASSATSAASAPVAAPASEPTTSIAGSADPNSGYIGEDAAKAAALAHAGLTEADLKAVLVKLEAEKGRAEYDVEFIRSTATGAEEYDYEIDALTGEVLSYDYDAEHYSGTQVVSGSAVTADQAKQIALNHAGVAESDTRAMELETDREDGRTVYEFSWKVGTTEYDYDIDADTGAILSYSQEQDD